MVKYHIKLWFKEYMNILNQIKIKDTVEARKQNL